MSWQNLLKKEKYIPFMPVIKAPVKKKNVFKIGNLSFTQTLKGALPEIQKDYVAWRTETQGLSLEAIGVVGKTATKAGKKYNDTLFEHIFDHVISEVQRPGQKPREGAEELMTLLENIIEDENSPITEEEADDIDELVEVIRKMGAKESDTNPANIPFTEPEELVEPKREGGKWGKKGSRTVWGHYRTPMYEDMRQKVHEESAPAKDSSWYSYEGKGIAKPPFWQGLFANSSLAKEEGKEVTNGLLGIIEKLKTALDEAVLGDVIIEDSRRADSPEFIKALASSTELINRLKTALKNQAIYRGNTATVMGSKLLEVVNNQPFTDKKWASEYLGIGSVIDISDLDDMPVGWDNVERYSLKLTIATIDNVINLAIRGTQMVAANGKKYYSLPTDKTHRKIRRLPWYSKFVQGYKKSEVKKSWIDMLWG